MTKEKNGMDIYLSEQQLKGLELLSKMTPEQLSKLPMGLGKKLSWVGRMFVWIDENIFSKTTRLWLYVLEIIGIVVIFIVVGKAKIGLNMIIDAKTELDLTKARMYMDSLIALAPAIAGMIVSISGALPAVIATFRSLGKKWKANGYKNENQIQEKE